MFIMHLNLHTLRSRTNDVVVSLECPDVLFVAVCQGQFTQLMRVCVTPALMIGLISHPPLN